MYGIDWRLASLGVMFFIGVYSVAIRKFFTQGSDWRVFLPLIALIGLGAFLYLLISFNDIRFVAPSIVPASIIAISVILVTLLSMLVYADPETKLNIAVPIMSMGMVSTAVLSIIFLGEKVTMQTAIGILLALIAILLLCWQ